MKVLEKIRQVIDIFLSSACAIVFAFMVLVCQYKTLQGYFLNSPRTVWEELLPYCFP